MKHIVLPTDFNIISLQPVHDVMRHYDSGEVRITLLHLLEIPFGIGDLLFRANRVSERYQPPATFMEACEVLLNRYSSRLVYLAPLIRHGSSAAFLDNLLKAIRTDAVAIQEGYKEQAAFEESVPVMPLVYRCDCTILETPLSNYRPDAKATVGDLLLQPY